MGALRLAKTGLRIGLILLLTWLGAGIIITRVQAPERKTGQEFLKLSAAFDPAELSLGLPEPRARGESRSDALPGTPAEDGATNDSVTAEAESESERLLEKARTHLAQGDFPAAEMTYALVLQMDPRNLEGLLGFDAAWRKIAGLPSEPPEMDAEELRDEIASGLLAESQQALGGGDLSKAALAVDRLLQMLTNEEHPLKEAAQFQRQEVSAVAQSQPSALTETIAVQKGPIDNPDEAF